MCAQTLAPCIGGKVSGKSMPVEVIYHLNYRVQYFTFAPLRFSEPSITA